jgi:predicted transcriptional regulator of viral defense system
MKRNMPLAPAAQPPEGSTPAERALALVRTAGVVRPRDLAAVGIAPEYLHRLLQEGEVVRLGRGLYALANADLGEHESLITACKSVPNSVICLLSALRFHGLTTQAPFEVWMAVSRSSWAPGGGGVPIRLSWLSGPALAEGVEEHQAVGGTVRVYGVAKTLADCFKFRNKVGLDVALEALQEARRQGKVSIDDIWRYARICRVANVMRPYLDAMW